VCGVEECNCAYFELVASQSLLVARSRFRARLDGVKLNARLLKFDLTAMNYHALAAGGLAPSCRT
jgi:hypothetical protein